jgi:hypothetical protein
LRLGFLASFISEPVLELLRRSGLAGPVPIEATLDAAVRER